jgi:MoaA/NifB/PqqE/SkfB family radical SAM enzyme
MTFEEFKTIFHKIPKTLTQIAFGADAGGFTNPDLFKMMEYCRNNDYNIVVPNITVADISDEVADKLAELAGAVAVSFYKHAGKDICYNSIKKLTDRGMKQVNIHWVVSKESKDQVDELIEDIKTDPRLKGLNALVMLSLKTKGRGEHFGPTSQEEYTEIVKKMFDNEIPMGADSCGAMKFLNAIKERTDYKELEQLIEPCESGKFSLYLDSYGKVYPCSFMEQVKWNNLDDYNGLQFYDMLNDIIDTNDFLNRVWNSKELLNFANGTTCANCSGEGCQIYKI